MSEVISFEEAKKQGRKLGEHFIQKEKQLNLDFTKLLDEVDSLKGEDLDMSYLASLLALEDNQFTLLAPVFLQELEKTYNTNENQLLLLRTMHLKNISLEDLHEEQIRLCAQVEQELKNVLSPYKIAFMQELLSMTYNTLASVDGIEKHVVSVEIELCNEDAKLPTYAHLSDSGMDVYATDEIIIHPGETVLVYLGFKVALPKGYELQIRPKSGRSLKTKLRIANTPGTIDSGYRDEVGIILENTEQYIKQGSLDEKGYLYNIKFGSDIVIGKGEKIAQLVLSQVPKVVWHETTHVFEVPGENRGGGFGSTGDK